LKEKVQGRVWCSLSSGGGNNSTRSGSIIFVTHVEVAKELGDVWEEVVIRELVVERRRGFQ